VAATVRLETDDLTIENGLIASNRVREFGAEIWPGLLFAAAPRDYDVGLLRVS